MGAHAYLPPSGAAGWVACDAWAEMNATYPKPPTDESREGTAAHVVPAEVLHGVVPHSLLGQVVEFDDDPNTVEIDPDMVRHGTAFAEWVREYAEGQMIYIEQHLHMPSIHPQNAGTPDAFVWKHRNRLGLFDYKYGHDFVDAFENWQLIDYTAGVLDWFGVDGVWDQELVVDIHIYQPNNYDRSGPKRVWSVRASDLRSYFNRLRNSAEANARPGPKRATPNDACLHCGGRMACESLQQTDYRIVQVVREQTPFNLTAEQAGRELRLLEDAALLLKARITGLQDEVSAAIQRGNVTTGYMLESTPGRAKWTADAEAVIAIGQLYGVAVAKEREVITPKQAIDAGLPADVVKTLSRRGNTAPKLVRAESSQIIEAFKKG